MRAGIEERGVEGTGILSGWVASGTFWLLRYVLIVV